MGRVPQMYDAKVVPPLIYEPLSQARLHQAALLATYPLTVAVRPRLPVSRAIPVMRSLLVALLPDVEPPTVSTMTDVYDSGFGGTRLRLYTAVVAVVASLTLLLAIVGIGGAVAESARSRTRELGIRLALGSSQWSVVTVVCRDAARLLATGVTAGVILSLTLATTMARVAFGGAPAARPRGVLLAGPDVSTPTLLIASATIAVVGLIAAGFPAIRASRLDPMAVLRADAQ
jgi:ABC-type antimicrobial peptide transport system permease subunit